MTERSLVPYVPEAQLTLRQGPPLALSWIIIEGDQPPLLSKGEFERAVRETGSRIVSTDDSHLDVTVYVLTTASGESITHVARKSGSYTLLKGDFDNNGSFVTSPNGKEVLIVDSGAMVNVLGRDNQDLLTNVRPVEPEQKLFGAGSAPLALVGQGDMTLLLTHNPTPKNTLPRNHPRLVQSVRSAADDPSFSSGHGDIAPPR